VFATTAPPVPFAVDADAFARWAGDLDTANLPNDLQEDPGGKLSDLGNSRIWWTAPPMPGCCAEIPP